MALVSPGVEVSVVDESQYLPAATNSVPYLLIATAQNKVSGTGTGVATATTAANANNIQLVTSQRELASLYGSPFFYSSTNGTPLNGYELNEYGLLAAHSVLGVSNRAYVQRVDVDLAALSARLTRPVGDADDNSYWLDTAETKWGLFEFSATTGKFTNKVPVAITSTDDLTGGVPKASVGAIGDYAVVTTNTANPVYYKNSAGAWVLVGSDDWQNAWYSVQSGTTNPVLTAGHTIIINGITVTASGTTVTSLASDINTLSIAGITAAAVEGKLEIYADSDVTPEGSAGDGAWDIIAGTGTLLTDLSITAGTKYAPEFTQAKHTSLPRWKSTDTTARPTGSLWQKTTSVNNGANIVVKQYDEATDAWTTITVPLYADDATANKELDPAGGGRNVTAGVVYGYLDWSENYTATLKLHVRSQTGETTVTSTTANPTITTGSEFTISASAKGSSTMTTAVTATVSGTTIQDYASAFNTAGVANTVASVTDGILTIKHTQGGAIELKDTTNTATLEAFGISALADLGANTRVKADGSTVIFSNWNSLTYEAKATEPTQDPANLTYWYHSAVDEVDMLVHDGSNWKGYLTVTNDVRGFNLSNTNAKGIQVSASAPTTQNDTAKTALAYGDLWLDSSDLENYPIVKRWESVDGTDQWVTIDNADQTTENGILFADARWSTADVDPVSGDIATITALASSNYLDADAPSAALYPAGTLLFNTRRSGYTVKQYKTDYFNATDFPDASLPTNKDAWVTVSGNKADGSPYMGRKAQRQVVVAAMKAGIDTNTAIREEQREFNLLAAPGYPELIQNMVALNNDRNNTGFVIGDTPFRLSDNSTALQNWASDAGGEGTDGEDGLVTNDPYASVFYPSARANDLTGTAVVVPASHAILRTIIRNDEQGYPWLAPAGNRRGLIDNVTALGYVTATGEFEQVANRESVRDTLYENNVNPLTFVPGSGLTNYGNKTVAGATSALDRINVARLVAYLRGKLEATGKAFMFEPNDTITRNEVKNAVEQLLNDITAKRGIYDYLVVCDETNNTPARIDRNELYIDIAIEPTKAVEFIYIPVRIKNTGEIEAGNL